MAFLSTVAGIALLATIVVATGVLCYAVLSMLNRLEVAVVANPPTGHRPSPDRVRR